MKKSHSKRIWLNPKDHDDTGAMSILIEPGFAGKSVYAGVSIRDCTRQVSLSFDASNRRELRQRLKKLDDMIGLLEETKEKLEEFFDD